MRWLVGWLLLVLSLDIRAGEFFLIPEYNPKPIYPIGLQRAGIFGDVRVKFTVRADGSVGHVNVLASDHPDLSQATRIAIEQWRFKPWKVEKGKPAEQDVVAPMFFRFDAPVDVNLWLKELECRVVNEALVLTPESSWIDSAAFLYTRAYLSGAFFQRQISTEKRLALIAKLNHLVPSIARQCLDNPAGKYVSYLPEDLRQLL
ncbi:energy transducer TonB [Pseudomonas sp. KB_15]|uniref:energy transducer TonB n=1 Tax=Pseudomonas sp. KB_15 TaxID=3233035 RepID=UPI003F9453E0